MSCDPERLTAYVDGEIAGGVCDEIGTHLATCTACSEQLAAERDLRARLRALPAVEPRPGFEDGLRRRLRRAGRSRVRLLLPLAAGLALGYVWIRGSAPFVAWEMARDHAHCFAMKKLPAAIESGDPEEIVAWFNKDRDSAWMPAIPAAVGPFELVGARYCPFPGASRAAHVYYVGGGRQVSLFVLGRHVRLRGTYSTTVRGRPVSLFGLAGTTVGIVGERARDVEAFERSLMTAVAANRAGRAAPPRLTLPSGAC